MHGIFSSLSAAKSQFRMGKAIYLWICSLSLMCASVQSQAMINLTLLDSAVPKGAVCLDGSAPSYYYAEGSGSGSNSWIVFLEGGGWCNSIDDCRNRSLRALGSSLYSLKQTSFEGLLDLDHSFNPNFYNWHKVQIHYCDGASFMADVEHPVSNLTFRGARIFKVMMEELLSKGMKNAQNAILTGTSAGGLATILHCDRFKALFPSTTTKVKCISDSGFFIHGEGLPGSDGRVSYYAQVIATHELKKSLPTSCTQKMDPNLCLFPEYLVGDIKTPVFLIESAFDAYQTIEQGVSNWYFDRSPNFRMIDTQNDEPWNCTSPDNDILNQRCLATHSPVSYASSQIVVNKLICIVMQIMIMFLYYI